MKINKAILFLAASFIVFNSCSQDSSKVEFTHSKNHFIKEIKADRIQIDLDTKEVASILKLKTYYATTKLAIEKNKKNLEEKISTKIKNLDDFDVYIADFYNHNELTSKVTHQISVF